MKIGRKAGRRFLAIGAMLCMLVTAAFPQQSFADVQAAEARQVTLADMWASGTCNTWLFCGGTEGVADFASGGTTRNWVGLFEDMLRYYGSFVERGRFVFNTSKRGADVAYILDHYDSMIAPYGTLAVGIMVGAADYQKGFAGEYRFKDDLQVLVEQIQEDGKLPILLTPYPSVHEEDRELAELYRDAVLEIAGEEVAVVDLTGLSTDLVREDGSLTASGHQTVANLIKTTLSVRAANNSIPVTNYALNTLSDGSYTVAKKAEDGSLAQLEEAEGGRGSITAGVAAESLRTDTVRLTYRLEDAKGQVISGSAAKGQLRFTIEGLKPGETYTLTVYDTGRGNVAESYQPARITASEGAKGAAVAYEDGNRSVNDKICSLLKSEKPATYLFMGDSITHGIVTQGYDNVPQMFAKYLDELGRTDDIVLNTGVSNATIATTLDQIEPRLMRYDPDVVLIMLGTNDVSYNGENTVTNGTAARGAITVQQFKDRYKELVRKVHENNADTSIVLRVPSEMIVDQAHSGYEEKFASIYDVADEMKEEIPGLNITVVDHRKEWLDYRENVRNDNISMTEKYGWLVDIVHPNGRGNLSMFQQIIKELGLYVNTSELANYRYELNDWTGTSEIAAPVTQRGTRAQFLMGALSGYPNGLKEVTVTLTEGGRAISKTAAYAQSGMISLDGLDPAKSYGVSVTGKDANNSREISFAASLVKSSDETATEAEKQELLDALAAAGKTDTSAYPPEVRSAFENTVKAIEDTYAGKAGLTVTELDTAIAAVKTAVADAERAFAAARKEAADAVHAALAKADAKYQAGQQNYTAESWNAYVKAYQAVKAANVDNTSVTALRALLAALNEAEAKLAAIPDQPAEPTPVPKQEIEKGKTYTVGKYRYKVTDVSKKTAEVAGAKNTVSKITVGSQVTIKGQSFKITGIAAAAFKGNKNAASASIGANVASIGKNAFAGCTKLGTVTIKSTKLKQIGAKAFYNCRKLKKITLKTSVLKTVGKNAFQGTAAKLVIKVPKAKLKSYQGILAKKGQGKKAKVIK